MSFQQTVHVEREYKEPEYDDFSRTTNNLKKVMKRLEQENMNARRNIDGGDLRSNKKSTRDRKGFDHWMKHSGRWIDKGMIMKSSKLEAWLEMSHARHSGKPGKGISFEKLGLLHNGIFAEWDGAPVPGKERGEFWGVTKSMEEFLKSDELGKWIGFDVVRCQDRAKTKRQKV